MNTTSKLVMTSVIALALAAPLLAQEQNTLLERNVYLFTPEGQMVKMAVDEQKHAMIMRQLQPMNTAVLAYASAGKVYMAEDRKMESGKMLSAEIFGTDPGIGSQK
jgi:hypothetical protein